MKTREGFVSNSSSSSFIVAVSKCNADRIEVKIPVDLTEFGDVLTTEKEVYNAFASYWGNNFKKERDLAKDFLKAIEAINAGKVVLFGIITNEDEVNEYMIYSLGIPETEGLEIIQNVSY